MKGTKRGLDFYTTIVEDGRLGCLGVIDGTKVFSVSFLYGY